MKWIISELYYPDEVSTAQIMTDISLEFAKYEKVGVICGPTGYERTYKSSDKILPDNIIVYRVNSNKLDKNSIFSRILRMLSISFKMAYHIATKVKKNDQVLIVTNPAFLLVLIAMLKAVNKFNLTILVHDVFPENLIPAGLANIHQFKFKVTKRIFNWAYKKADRLIALGEDMKDLLSSKLNRSNIVVIPNWADSEIQAHQYISPSDYFQLPLTGKTVIGFAGNIGRVQGIYPFLEIFRQANNPNLALVLIGDGAIRKEIEEKLRNEKWDNIFLVGSKPRSEQNNFLNAVDISLVILAEGMKGLGVPSKTYNIMASGKPILYLGDNGSEVDMYIRKYHNGWTFHWQDKDALLKFLTELSPAKNEVFDIMGKKSTYAVNSNYRKEVVLSKFIELLK